MSENRYVLLKPVDFMAKMPTNSEVIIEMLKTAIHILEVEDGSRAAWRIADAGLMLRSVLENRKEKDLQGLDEPTGMGAMLPNVIRKTKGGAI